MHACILAVPATALIGKNVWNFPWDMHRWQTNMWIICLQQPNMLLNSGYRHTYTYMHAYTHSCMGENLARAVFHFFRLGPWTYLYDRVLVFGSLCVCICRKNGCIFACVLVGHAHFHPVMTQLHYFSELMVCFPLQLSLYWCTCVHVYMAQDT